MRSERRLAKLESSLPPRGSVLHWLAEVHEHGSLANYMTWLLDQPASRAPLIVIRERARAAARSAYAGQPRPLVRAAEDRGVADAVFLFMLVLELERMITEMIRIGSLRLDALRWESRARTAEGTPDRDGWKRWRTAVRDLVDDLSRTEAVGRRLEDRYLGGREVIAPDTVVAWRGLCEGSAALLATAGTVRGGRRRRADRGAGHAVERTAAEEGRILVERVRARTIDVLGDHAGASAIVERAQRGSARSTSSRNPPTGTVG